MFTMWPALALLHRRQNQLRQMERRIDLHFDHQLESASPGKVDHRK